MKGNKYTQENEKRQGSRSSNERKSWRVQTQNGFACCVNEDYPIQNVPHNPNHEGEVKTLLHQGKANVFGVFFPKKIKKMFLLKWCSSHFKFLPTLQIPPLILRKNHAAISFCCVDIAGYRFLIKIENLTWCPTFNVQLAQNTIGPTLIAKT